MCTREFRCFHFASSLKAAPWNGNPQHRLHCTLSRCTPNPDNMFLILIITEAWCSSKGPPTSCAPVRLNISEIRVSKGEWNKRHTRGWVWRRSGRRQRRRRRPNVSDHPAQVPKIAFGRMFHLNVSTWWLAWKKENCPDGYLTCLMFESSCDFFLICLKKIIRVLQTCLNGTLCAAANNYPAWPSLHTLITFGSEPSADKIDLELCLELFAQKLPLRNFSFETLPL